MDTQQEQQNQKLNQKAEYASAFLEEEVVEESAFDEPRGEQEKLSNLMEKQQNESEEAKKPKKPKRPRKTIEQELADLDARRQRLVEKKRSQDAHEKIVFGATVIAMLADMRKNNDKNFYIIKEKIKSFVKDNNIKDREIIDKIIG